MPHNPEEAATDPSGYCRSVKGAMIAPSSWQRDDGIEAMDLIDNRQVNHGDGDESNFVVATARLWFTSAAGYRYHAIALPADVCTSERVETVLYKNIEFELDARSRRTATTRVNHHWNRCTGRLYGSERIVRSWVVSRPISH